MDEFQKMQQDLLDARALAMTCGNTQALQMMLMSAHQQVVLRTTDDFSKHMRAAEAKWFSQNGEDGILLFLLARIGLNSEIPAYAAEVGAGNGWENNCINLAAHRGYDIMLIDPSWALHNLGLPEMIKYPSLAVSPPTVVDAMVEPESINDIFRTAGFDVPLALVSIDVDGNDFWLWRALEVADPMIVCIELNTQLGEDVAWTLPYTPKYDYWNSGVPGHLGASVRALDMLGRYRGYVFAGADRLGVNGFWVKAGLIPELGDGVSLKRVWERPRSRMGAEAFEARRGELPWVAVTEELLANGADMGVPFVPNLRK